MQRILTSLKQSLSQTIFVLGLMLLISLSGLFFSVQQSSYAATYSVNKLTPEQKTDRAYEYNEAAGIQEEKREEAYEKAIKDSESPQTVEKAYERELKTENVKEPNIIEKAENLIEKATSK